MSNTALDYLSLAFTKAVRKTPNTILAKQKPVINNRGTALAPDISISLKALKIVSGKDFSDLPVEEGRKVVDHEAKLAVASKIKISNVEDIEINGVNCRYYSSTPGSTITDNLVVYIHGGGWVLGSLDSHDITCRYVVQQTGFDVISIDYTLAPEGTYPKGLNDVDSVLDEFTETHNVIVMGDSAGGNLSLASTFKRIKDGKFLPIAVIPLVPVTDLHSFDTGSYNEFTDGFFLTKKQMIWYREKYLGSGFDESLTKDPLVSPIYASFEMLQFMPPTLTVVAGFDPLRDEGEAMHKRLVDAGVDAKLIQASDQVHPFVNSITLWEGAQSVMDDVITYIVDQFNKNTR